MLRDMSIRPAPKTSVRTFRATVTVRAPEKFLVRYDDRRKGVLAFFDSVTARLEAGSHVKMDFGSVREMHPCGTLLFLAKLDIWCHVHPGKLSATYPDDEVVEQLFQHFGILEAVGLSHRQEVTHDRVRYWFYFSGTKVEPGGYRDLTTAVRSSIQHPEPILFGDCLNEAVTNAVNHAYEFENEELPPDEMRKWWMLSQFKNDRLIVAIYDHGVSIPESLRRKPEWSDYLTLRRFKDARLIKVAASSFRTSTRLSHRGKGLPEMLEFSSSLSQGGLSIMSNHGGWAYRAADHTESTVSFANPLPGTLLLWELAFRPGVQQ